MQRIHLLSDELISQIAAGEVIERPASAVKELVENSLDAGATRVAVELEEGGLQKIRVVDDGIGMAPEDARLAFVRHATSKLGGLEDLFAIRSLGFRGEALASIGSIARVELRTREREARVGTMLVADAGKILSEEECACAAGTDITVLSLFHATPARRKYMKSVNTEFMHCFDLLAQLSMAHPHVAFRLMKDGELVFDLPAQQGLQERVHSLYGATVANALLPLRYHQSNLMISGFVGKPELSRSSRKYQFIFMNGRPIESRLIGRAVEEAFHSLLMTDKYPWFALAVEVDPAFVDVNVHPRKLEVKFVNTQELYRAVFGAVQHALQSSTLAPSLRGQDSPIFSENFTPSSSSLPTALSMEFSDRAPMQDRRPDAVERDSLPFLFRPLTQVANCYIVAESEEGLVLIDQHAAHERVRYARFMKALEQQTPLIQPLLTPLQLDLGAESMHLLSSHMDDFTAMGFEIEAFGGATFLIRAVPDGLQKKDPERVIKEVLADVEREQRLSTVLPLREAIATSAACRGAIKFGDALTLLEMQALIRDMQETPHYTHCPHGRPAILTWSYSKLEELFKRKNF